MRYWMFSLLIVSLLTLTSCGNQESANETELLIAAASSLSGSLSEIKQEFEAEHPDTTLKLNFGASGKLSQQIMQGAPVDVFLSADQKWMDQLAKEDMIQTDTRIDFTQNNLVIISSQNTSFSINDLHDLTSLPTEQITIGDPESVPAGAYTKQALRESGIFEAVKDKLVYTSNAQQTLTYVESGNTEIGIVYASDLTRSELVNEIFVIDEDLHEAIYYPAAVTSTSQSAEKADEFIQFLQSDKAQAILEDYGFAI